MFDKLSFSKLLQKAQGKRSLNRFAADAGVSAAHLSRLTRTLLETAPSPPTIRKIADAAGAGVTYDDLMRAAGHLQAEGVRAASPPEPDVYDAAYGPLAREEYQLLFKLAKDATKDDLDVVIQMLRQLSKRGEPHASTRETTEERYD